MHEDATSTTFTLSATILSSAWSYDPRDLYDPPPFDYDPPLASNLLVNETVRPFNALENMGSVIRKYCDRADQRLIFTVPGAPNKCSQLRMDVSKHPSRNTHA